MSEGASRASELCFFVPFVKGRDGKVKPHPGTNELIDMRGRNRFGYASLKRTYTELAMGYALEAAQACGWVAPEGKVAVECSWVERNARRDPDNVEGGIKWLLDGVVKAGALKDDSQRYVARVTHEYAVDKERPGVGVTIRRLED